MVVLLLAVPLAATAQHVDTMRNSAVTAPQPAPMNSTTAEPHDPGADTKQSSDASAAPMPFAGEAAVRFSQAVVGRQLAEHRLIDQNGKEMTFAAFRGKPLIVSMIYTSCFHVCPTITRHLKKVSMQARQALGDDSFNVVSIGFDTTVDTPEQMSRFAREQGVADPNWSFVSTDAATIQKLADDLGFIYRRSQGGFDHLSQTTVIDGDGRVYRQIYGTGFETQLLVEPLKELLYGQPASALDVHGWVNNIKLFCTVYDPATGGYRFDYSVFVNFAIGVLCLGGMAIFIIRGWRQHGRTGAG